MTESPKRLYDWDWPLQASGTASLLHLEDAGLSDPDGEARARERDAAELEKLRTSPAVRILVDKFVRAKKGRTPEIPIRCGEAELGDLVVSGIAFGVLNDAVELIYFQRNGGRTSASRATGPRTTLGVEQYLCTCSRDFMPGHYDYVTTARLYRAGLEALARTAQDGRIRPVANLHTLLHRS